MDSSKKWDIKEPDSYPRDLRAELVCKEVSEEGEFTGYASIFGKTDLQNEVVESGAFKRTITRKSGIFPVLWQHNPDRPIGQIVEAKEDKRGLFVKGKLALGVSAAKDVYELLKAKVITAFSIGFRVVKDEWERNTGKRRLKELDLWEVSFVTFPANPWAKLRTVKSACAAFELPIAEDDTPWDPVGAFVRLINTQDARDRGVGIQSLSFAKSSFSQGEAAEWGRKHHFLFFPKQPLNWTVSADHYHVDQGCEEGKGPWPFEEGSCRTTFVTRGIEATLGKLGGCKSSADLDTLLDVWTLGRSDNARAFFIADVIDDVVQVVPKAIASAAATLYGVRGDFELSEKEDLKSVISRFYARMGSPAPWEPHETIESFKGTLRALSEFSDDALLENKSSTADPRTEEEPFAWLDAFGKEPEQKPEGKDEDAADGSWLDEYLKDEEEDA